MAIHNDICMNCMLDEYICYSCRSCIACNGEGEEHVICEDCGECTGIDDSCCDCDSPTEDERCGCSDLHCPCGFKRGGEI